jgi:hypothetical protein
MVQTVRPNREDDDFVADNAKLIAQLRTLLQLTQTEAQIAQTRVSQATTDAVRRELTENGRNAQARALEISDALRELGGAPDVVAPVLGRLSALAKTGAEQTSPIAEALLQDLALEHQLVDRSRYLRALAVAADRQALVKLADKLIDAHTATVDWLTTVLAEDALGGPAALAATPLQRVAGTATRVAAFPTRVWVRGANRYINFVQQTAEQARSRFSSASERAEQLTEDAAEVVNAGREASLKRAEKVARREGNTEAADAVHETRRNTGALQADELPIKNYDNLSTQDAIAAVKKLTEAEDVRAIIAYEQAHKARSSVVSATQTRLAAVAKEAAGLSLTR